jgi:competence protein ComEA
VLDKLKRWQQLFFGLLGGLLAAALLGLLSQRPAGLPITLLPPPATITPIPLRVQVKGAVKRPGLYTLPQNSILQDALTAAGGLTDKADPSDLNLAQLLDDGAQITVPELAPTAVPSATVGPGTPQPAPAPGAAASATPEGTSTASGPVNINSASLDQLETLPGIGPAIGQRIIDYRSAHGPFKTIEQIMNVKGIGPATFANLKSHITVK